jgi:hypothetical protein
MGPRPGVTVIGLRVALRKAASVALVVTAVSLAAASGAAQTISQQNGRPQPPPAQKPTAQPAGTDPAASPQAGGAKPADPQAAGARPPAGPQAAGTRTPPAKKSARPQTSKAWKGRGFAVVTAGAQLAAPGYTSASVFTVHAEEATLQANASVGIGPAFGARGGVRVWKNLALGGGVELVKTTQSLTVSGTLPHPFQFNQYRQVQGTADGLDRVEAMAAFEVSWLVALSRRIDMFVFAGPAYISVTQDMATRIQFAESYPYDTATFTGVDTASVSGSGFGVTGGVDVSYLLSKHLGLGGGLRYSYASATLKPSEQPSTVVLGGLQVAFGARVLF